MQIFANRSDEGVLKGLGWIKGNVKKILKNENKKKLLLPHMGWNKIQISKKNILLDNINKDSKFYFLHSYIFNPEHEENSLAKTEYHEKFSSIIFNNKNIYGVQFHPEKSHHFGEQILKNFAQI